MASALAQVTVSVDARAPEGAPTASVPGITAVPLAPITPNGPLPRTGMDAVVVLTVLAAVLVAVGVTAVRLARRRTARGVVGTPLTKHAGRQRGR